MHTAIVFFNRNENFLFSKDMLIWSKVTVKTFLFQINAVNLLTSKELACFLS